MTTVLVASGGGHLRQLAELAPRLQGVDEDHLWVTWESSQSRSLLAGKEVVYVRQTAPRDYLTVSRNLDHAFAIWRDVNATSLVTTGAQVALPFLLVGRLRGRPCHYIESAARSDAPSLSGKAAATLPGTKLYTQYRHWSDPRWSFVGSVFDGYSLRASPTPRQSPPRKVLVTLGTIPGWEFPRLVQACLRAIQPDAEIWWQTGSTDVSSFRIDASASWSNAEIERRTREADVVISHAGVGSALTALSAGKRPILVPRESQMREHVDDHQQQIAIELESRGLAVVRSPETLDSDALLEAMSSEVERADAVPPIVLQSPGRQGLTRLRRSS